MRHWDIDSASRHQHDTKKAVWTKITPQYRRKTEINQLQSLTVRNGSCSRHDSCHRSRHTWYRWYNRRCHWPNGRHRTRFSGRAANWLHRAYVRLLRCNWSNVRLAWCRMLLCSCIWCSRNTSNRKWYDQMSAAKCFLAIRGDKLLLVMLFMNAFLCYHVWETTA